MTDVLVVGSVHIDRMLRVDRLPDPGETGVATEAWTQLGGKAANQALAAAMRVPTALAACLGADAEADRALEMLQRNGVRTCVRRSARLPTGSSVALIDAAGENLGVISAAANSELSPSDVVPVIEELHPSLVLCQWESPLDALDAAMTTARQNGIGTLLNAAPWREDLRPALPLADHVIVNAVEAAAWTGESVESVPADVAFAHPSVVVTLGAGGVAHYRDGSLVLHQPAERVKVRSPHGAGDHFAGALAASLAAGVPLATAMRDASRAAGKWVETLHKNLMYAAPPVTASV